MTDDRELIREMYRKYWRCMIEKDADGLRGLMAEDEALIIIFRFLLELRIRNRALIIHLKSTKSTGFPVLFPFVAYKPLLYMPCAFTIIQ